MTPSLSLFKNLSVREKILVILLSLSLISLLIMGAVAFTTIMAIGNYAKNGSLDLGETAKNGSTVALAGQSLANLNVVAENKALIVNLLFNITDGEMEILAAQAVTLQNNTPLNPRVRSFSRNDPPTDKFEGTFAFLVPNSTTTENSEEYRKLAGMDDLLKKVFQEDGDMTAIYIATDSGIMRKYPYDNRTDPDYNPRERTWFNDAKKSSKVVWGDPYDDKGGNGRVVTSSRAVPTKYGTWVIASDFTLQQITDNILNFLPDHPGSYHMLLTGERSQSDKIDLNNNPFSSSFLIDNKGEVISGPCLTDDNTKCEVVFGTHNILNSSHPDLVGIGNKMIAGGDFFTTITIDNQKFYIAYAPIQSMNWSLAFYEPASEVMALANMTRTDIQEKTNGTTKEINDITFRILVLFGGLFCILLIVVLFLSFRLARLITRPVEVLRQGTVAIGKGDLDYHLAIDSGDEFEGLANSFNSMTLDLKKNIEDLRRTTAEKERYSKEMEIAKEIQDTFLPECIPVIPGIELAATTIPAMEIGGDLYDFIPLGQDRWGLAIADVSGKGVSAALFMALSRTLIRVSGISEVNPSVALQRANRLIYEDGRSSMFITVFYSVLDPVNKTFTYANAGHNPPLLVRRDSSEVQFLDDGRCIALGVVPEVGGVPGKRVLESGDLLILYTDGVTEAFNPQNEEFGDERLASYVKKHRDDPIQKILAGIIDEIRTFSDSAPQSDDITLIVVRDLDPDIIFFLI